MKDLVTNQFFLKIGFARLTYFLNSGLAGFLNSGLAGILK